MNKNLYIKMGETGWVSIYKQEHKNGRWHRIHLFTQFDYYNENRTLVDNNKNITRPRHALLSLTDSAMKTRKRRVKTYNIIDMSEREYNKVYERWFVDTI